MPLDGGIRPTKTSLWASRVNLLKDLPKATYAAFVIAFAQSLHIIAKASREHDRNLDSKRIMRIWRWGCIIQSDYITDLFERIYERADHDDDDLLSNHEIREGLQNTYPSRRTWWSRALESDGVVPALSADLEFYKYDGSTDLPTQFMKAQLDYFGGHIFDLKGAEPGKPVTGKHHFEWKPAKGIYDDRGTMVKKCDAR